MAVLDTVRGLKVEVFSNGSALPEHPIEESDEQTASSNTHSCYVQAVSGVKFEVIVEVLPGFRSREDGLCNDASEIASKIDKLGVIELACYSCQVKGRRKASSSGARELAKLGCIPEKALKGHAKDLTLDFGPAKRAGSKQQRRAVSDLAETPFAKYRFRYLSKAALQSLLIIPRTPPPVPLEDRPVDELSPDQLRELVLRSRAKTSQVKNEVQIRGVKREAEEHKKENPGITKVNKRQRKFGNNRFGAVKAEAVETIDLT
ncbi:MAG: hypothetical protein M1828_001137 [Chrysothrix sp. TS-e1954]|nr:MAG: hypothetical protein M1828_001137 [Chrysothrix sp. TS-e1954]